MSIPKSDCVFTEELDLTDEQIAITRQTYLQHAKDYVDKFERKPGWLEMIRPYTLDPFLNYYFSYNLSKPILFVGCGSGRDLQEVEKMGVSAEGIDTSSSMLEIGKRMGVKSPLSVMTMENLTFPDQRFHGIFCETAISHIKKSQLLTTLTGFNRVLDNGGICLIGFRQGNGKVYFVDDIGGPRYNTTVTEDETLNLLKQAGFDIIKVIKADNPLPDRPSHLDCFIRKMS